MERFQLWRRAVFGIFRVEQVDETDMLECESAFHRNVVALLTKPEAIHKWVVNRTSIKLHAFGRSPELSALRFITVSTFDFL